MTVAIMGCGGHGGALGDFLTGMSLSVVYLDDEPKGLPVVGGSDRLEDGKFLRMHSIVVGIGDNKLRSHFSLIVVSNGGMLFDVRHRASTVSPSARLGIGCQYFPGSIVGSNSKLGDFVIVNNKASVAHDCIVRTGAQIADGGTLGGRAYIGKRTLIGLGAVVMPTIRVGDDCIVGAGAVVTRDVPDRTIVYGNPARVAA